MKFAIEGDHKYFFENEHWVEFEGLLTSKQCLAGKEAVVRALRSRLPKSAPELSHLSLEEFFLHGRDLWRDDAELKGLVCRAALSNVAAELLDTVPLRLAFTQVLATPSEKSSVGVLDSKLIPMLEGTTNVESMGPVQGVVGGLLLCLSAPAEELPAPFPKTAGSGVYLSKWGEFDYSPLRSSSGGLYMLLVFSAKSSVYVDRAEDPVTHCFKDLGYGYGDRLRDDTHPLLVR